MYWMSAARLCRVVSENKEERGMTVVVQCRDSTTRWCQAVQRSSTTSDWRNTTMQSAWEPHYSLRCLNLFENSDLPSSPKTYLQLTSRSLTGGRNDCIVLCQEA